LSYGDRLRNLGLPTLQYRRIRADLVVTYKIIKNVDKVDCTNIFPIGKTNTRGHKPKIFKKHCRTNRRKYSFSQRVVDHWNSLPDKVVVDHWNSLPDKVVEASSVDSFKSSINKHGETPLKLIPDFYGPKAGHNTRRQLQICSHSASPAALFKASIA
jgi:hypothetical protein